MKRYMRRRVVNYFNQGMSVAATLFGLFFMGWLMWTLISEGAAYLDWRVFTENTPGPGSAGGGLANAIMGTVMLTVFGVLFGAPIGILAGTYLCEYGRRSWITPLVRFINDVLLSAPSIVLGVFVYEVMVVHMGQFSGWAGAVALALIVIPVVVRTTDNMLGLVPDTMREAAVALGAPRWRVTVWIVYRSAMTGLVTGIVLATAQIVGETAPLLFTSLGNQFWNLDMNRPMPALPLVIFNFAMSPYERWQHLAWAGALLITLSVLIMNIAARAVLRSRNTD
ncbi:phosphate ABC transporter, permease protein PstA [Acidihalobacter yilgarnensis]|uniref:Phosphate transport system permease protein PstA n=1 Tax=Acidihalobacter yilgarnensis TaxID=2819280 RepID=A0A1D8IPG2_9GAMM|nr:phosphate ABC transporter permease PstA [Acidihalobacter yilgarnensis]AOU98388.1 phosphate ABC transporter, permease protein PstA [Acidihalobacter yilgarnensis]